MDMEKCSQCGSDMVDGACPVHGAPEKMEEEVDVAEAGATSEGSSEAQA